MNKINNSRNIRVHKERRRKLFFCFFISSLVILCVFGSYFAYTLIDAVSIGLDKNAKKSKLRNQHFQIKKDPFAILLIGTDGRISSSTDWRPDVLMIAAINPKLKSIKLISIPRDTYTEIANTHGFKTKINAAAHWGYQKHIDPVQNIRETIENLLHIPIDYYAKANFQGFTDAVNILGGVNVNVDFPFEQQAIGGKVIEFNQGPMQLNGDEALAYVRMRKKDPKGDHGRNKRQQEVISNLLDKLIGFEGLSKFRELTKAIGQNISYSIPINEIPALTHIYKECKPNLESITIGTTPSKRHGIWYEDLPDSERQRIVHILQEQLEFKPRNNEFHINK